MDTDLARALREATSLTRASRLPEATQRIQAALGGGTLPFARQTAPATARREPVGATLQIEHDPDERAGAKADSPRPAGGVHQFGQPLRGLGEAVQALRHGRLARPSLLKRQNRAAPHVPDGATFLDHTFTSGAGSRAYKLYLPRSRPAAGLPLVVMLHGCTQDPDDFAVGTAMNALSEELGFVVAYPAQPASANPSLCWNWFAQKDQMRGAGEPALIAGLTMEVASRHDLDRGRTFVAGLSAGGAMAAVMGHAYSDLYAAVGVHSGLAYGVATDVISALAAMRGDPGARLPAGGKAALRVPTIVFHGDADGTVHPSNGARFLDVHPGSRDVDTGTSNGRAYARTTVRNPDGTPMIEHWLVNGAGHAWSGGNPEGSFADRAGPDASRAMLRFFLATARPASPDRP